MLNHADLNQFTSTTQYYKHCLRQFIYTDGVKYLAEKANAYWLLDAIASHQPQLLKDHELKEFQHWKLTMSADHTAQLVCFRDTDEPVLAQHIEFTDFPLNEVRLYLVKKVLLLPSEY